MWKSKFYGAFVLNRRVDLHAIDATPARWRGDAGSSPLDGAHPTHWLISTQVFTDVRAADLVRVREFRISAALIRSVLPKGRVARRPAGPARGIWLHDESWYGATAGLGFVACAFAAEWRAAVVSLVATEPSDGRRFV